MLLAAGMGWLRAQSPLDGFDPNTDALVTTIAVQADGKILIGGDFTLLAPNSSAAAVVRNHIARLNADGSLDSSFDPNANGNVATIVVQSDGKILIGGAFTTLSPNGGAAVGRNRMARLNSDGTVDASFDPQPNLSVQTIAVQSDGKVLIGGQFTMLSPNGGAAATRNNIARLNADGTLDASFDPNANSFVTAIVVQPDGGILVGGGFTKLSPNGGAAVARRNLGRLTASGALDISFDPSPNDVVSSIALQADGGILVAGSFKTLSPNGGAAVTRNRIARLNRDGTVDRAYDPNADSVILSMAVQADGKVCIGGFFTTLSPNGKGVTTVDQVNIARLNIDGTVDLSFHGPGTPNDGVLTVAMQPGGKILVGGFFKTITPASAAAVSRNHMARLETDGRLDRSLDSNANNLVGALAVQGDGKILIGGGFSFLSPNSADTFLISRIALLNTDGTAQTGFHPQPDNDVAAIVVQPDGKILIGGYFVTLSPSGTAVPRNRMARLNADGTLDGSFDPNANDGITAIALQPDGKILVAGSFTTLSPNGGATFPRNRLARLNADGTVDVSFNPNPNEAVMTIALQADGKMIIGGDFTTLAPNGGAVTTRNNIARLNTDGTLDTAFDPNPNFGVKAIVVQSDGKILLAGGFTTLAPNGGAVVTRNRIARLKANGTLDLPNFGTAFDPSANDLVDTVAVQANGKILIGGEFTTLSPNGGAAVTRNRIARLNSDGTVDTAFNPNADHAVLGVALAADGKILVGGQFSTFSPNGGSAITRNGIARLSNDTAALQNLSVSQNTLTWTRTGAVPHMSRAIFEQSDDGVIYSFLGNATRVSTFSSFTLTGQNLPTGRNLYLRARGFYRGAEFSGSESVNELVQNVFLPPGPIHHFAVTAQASVTATAPFNFTVTAQDQFNTTVSTYAGTVHFTSSDGAASLPADYTFVASDKGAHTFTGTLRTAGTQIITAADAALTGTSANIAVSKATTTTRVTSSANPSQFGQKVTFTATVGVVPPGSGIVSGTVQFRVDGARFGNPLSLVGNSAKISDSTLSAGNHTVAAVYTGNSSFLPSTNSLAEGQTVNVAPTPTATATATPGSTPTPTASSTPTPTPTPTPTATSTPAPTPPSLGNISTRLRVETGEDVLIGGFIVTGLQPKKVIVRAIGPSLPVSDGLQNPILELHSKSSTATNDNWVEAPDKQAIIDTTVAPKNDLESAILTPLPANGSAYTAVVRGVNGGTGVGLVEVFDLDRSVDSRLANISTRGLVKTGENAMIGGFIVLEGSQKVIVRAIGPSLPVAGRLADPFLELHDVNGAVLQSNDNWRTGGQEAEIIATTVPPPNDREAAIVRTLAPGKYTAVVRGVNNSTGVALVEVYALK